MNDTNERHRQLQRRLADVLSDGDARRLVLNISRTVSYGSAAAYLVFILVNLILLAVNGHSLLNAGNAAILLIPLLVLVAVARFGVDVLYRQFDRAEKNNVSRILAELFPDARCRIETSEPYPSLINVSFFFGNFDRALSFGEISFLASGIKVEVRDVLVGSDSFKPSGNFAPSLIGDLLAYASALSSLILNRRPSSAGSFRGLLANARIGKTVQGCVVILPDYLVKTLRSMRTIRDNITHKPEEPEFNRLFSVYSTNEATARLVLTPSMMKCLSGLRNKYGRDVMLSFVGDHISFAVSIPEGFLSFGTRPAQSEKALADLHESISAIKEIISILRNEILPALSPY